MKLKELGRQKFKKIKILLEATFRPASGFKERTFHSFGVFFKRDLTATTSLPPPPPFPPWQTTMPGTASRKHPPWWEWQAPAAWWRRCGHPERGAPCCAPAGGPAPGSPPQSPHQSLSWPPHRCAASDWSPTSLCPEKEKGELFHNLHQTSPACTFNRAMLVQLVQLFSAGEEAHNYK